MQLIILFNFLKKIWEIGLNYMKTKAWFTKIPL